ncbi:MAG: DUF6605 domain-containing protein [Phycisphaerae bacterium]
MCYRTLVFILPVTCALPLTATAQNPIQTENALAGTTSWMLGSADNSAVTGYASATSIDHCSATPLQLFISSTSPFVFVHVYRLGWYGGAGGRLVSGPILVAGGTQPTPTPDAITRMIECNWTASATIQPTCSWVSGQYVAVLTNFLGGAQSYVPFVVRDDARPSLLLYQASVSTWQAYNPWGGKSLYGYNSTDDDGDGEGDAALVVSFDRPYADGFGSGQLFSYEINMIHWLEREGYDVTYGTNIDAHRDLAFLVRHQALLSVGHDEYWSWEMRSNFEAARDLGINLGFFSANSVYWQIRLDPDGNGVPNRRIVEYRDSAGAIDPLALDGNPSNDYLITRLWRENTVKPPENQLIGVMYDGNLYPVLGDYTVSNAAHWVFAGTGLHNGDRLPGLVGYEADHFFPPGPSGVQVVASSIPLRTDTNQPAPLSSDSSVYSATSGATVFATGTIQWAWGLDDLNGHPDFAHPPLSSPAAQQITRNVLARLAQSPLGGTWVDFTYAGTETGGFTQPFNTLAEGVAAAAGGTVRIKAGVSSERLTLWQPALLTAWNGSALVGP